jgi:hypothetical protein
MRGDDNRRPSYILFIMHDEIPLYYRSDHEYIVGIVIVIVIVFVLIGMGFTLVGISSKQNLKNGQGMGDSSSRVSITNAKGV